jgi:hypothetical protein
MQHGCTLLSATSWLCMLPTHHIVNTLDDSNAGLLLLLLLLLPATAGWALGA